MKPTFGSLFAGIGGIDLGLERAGWECRWQVENDEFCTKVLERRWPDVKKYGDCRSIDPKELEPVDLICGGFPCQSVSTAGKRKGENDPRWLWPEFRRFVRFLEPRWVLAENVPGLFSIDSGRVFGRILRNLAEIGYDAEWDCLPAAAFGAPHFRYRVFIVAYSQAVQREAFERGEQDGILPQVLADTDDFRQREQGFATPSEDKAEHRLGGSGQAIPRRAAAPDKTMERTMADTNRIIWKAGRHCATEKRPRYGKRFQGMRSFTDWWAIEPDVGRMANGVPSRVDRLRSLGNAVVPQVAEWIGKRIIKHG